MDARKRRAIGQLISQCCAYWERPEPEKKTLDLWFEELVPIPEKDMGQIYIKFKRLDLWPKNYPKKILEIWRSLPRAIQPPNPTDEKLVPIPNFVRQFIRNFGLGKQDAPPDPPPG